MGCYCGNRLCTICNKGRDRHYVSRDLENWKWIRDWKPYHHSFVAPYWNRYDWQHWYDNSVWENFERPIDVKYHPFHDYRYYDYDYCPYYCCAWP